MSDGRPVAESPVTGNGTILALAAFVAPLLSIYAPLGMAPLLAIVAVAVLGGDIWRARGWPRDSFSFVARAPLLRLAAAVAVLLVCWASISALWAVQPFKAAEAAAQFAGVALAAVVLFGAAAHFDDDDRRSIGRALTAGVCAALAIYALERLTDGLVARQFREFASEPEAIYSPYNRGLSVLVLLAVPALLMPLRRRPRWFVPTLGIALFAVVAAYYAASLQVAAVMALAAFIGAILLPRWMPWLIGAALALFVAIAPLLPPLVLPQMDISALSARTGSVSIGHRLLIWQFAAERIAEKPLAGWGMNAARAIPGGKELVTLSMTNDRINSTGERMPLHSHNAALQWWLELGAIGAAAMAALWLLALAAIRRHIVERLPRAIALSGYVAAFAIANLSYGAWQSWWLATLALASVLTAAMILRRSPS